MSEATQLSNLQRPAQGKAQPAGAKASLLVSMAKNFQMEPKVFLDSLKATVLRPGKDGRMASNEEVAAFLAMCQEYQLNPFTKEIHAFRDKDGTIVPVIGVDGWVTLVNRNPAFDGVEFDYKDDEQGRPYSVTCIMYRRDRSRPIKVTEFYEECSAHAKGKDYGPWKTHPRRFTRHRSFIQCARLAFGFGGLLDETEAIEGDFTPLNDGMPAEFETTGGRTIESTTAATSQPAAIEHQESHTLHDMGMNQAPAEVVEMAASRQPEQAPAATAREEAPRRTAQQAPAASVDQFDF